VLISALLLVHILHAHNKVSQSVSYFENSGFWYLQLFSLTLHNCYNILEAEYCSIILKYLKYINTVLLPFVFQYLQTQRERERERSEQTCRNRKSTRNVRTFPAIKLHFLMTKSTVCV
jgi:hypothetical protein